jgi:hypothetical protein
VLPPTTTAAFVAYLATRAATPDIATAANAVTATDRMTGRPPLASGDGTGAPVAGPLLATNSGGFLDQAALWCPVCRLARAARIEHWAALSPTQVSLINSVNDLAVVGGAIPAAIESNFSQSRCDRE